MSNSLVLARCGEFAPPLMEPVCRALKRSGRGSGTRSSRPACPGRVTCPPLSGHRSSYATVRCSVVLPKGSLGTRHSQPGKPIRPRGVRLVARRQEAKKHVQAPAALRGSLPGSEGVRLPEEHVLPKTPYLRSSSAGQRVAPRSPSPPGTPREYVGPSGAPWSSHISKPPRRIAGMRTQPNPMMTAIDPPGPAARNVLRPDANEARDGYKIDYWLSDRKMT